MHARKLFQIAEVNGSFSYILYELWTYMGISISSEDIYHINKHNSDDMQISPKPQMQCLFSNSVLTYLIKNTNFYPLNDCLPQDQGPGSSSFNPMFSWKYLSFQTLLNMDVFSILSIYIHVLLTGYIREAYQK